MTGLVKISFTILCSPSLCGHEYIHCLHIERGYDSAHVRQSSLSYSPIFLYVCIQVLANCKNVFFHTYGRLDVVRCMLVFVAIVYMKLQYIKVHETCTCLFDMLQTTDVSKVCNLNMVNYLV